MGILQFDNFYHIAFIFCAYASRYTNVAESNYAPTKLEVVALVYAVDQFEVYLLGSDFTVYTDH